MNERIAALAREAGLTEQRSEPTQDFPAGVLYLAGHPHTIEALVKLVAKDCAEVVKDESVENTGHPEDEAYNKALDHSASAIRERYGL